MTRDQIKYLEHRAEESRKAAEAADGIVRQTHEQFVNAYIDRIAQARIARLTVDEILG